MYLNTYAFHINLFMLSLNTIVCC